MGPLVVVVRSPGIQERLRFLERIMLPALNVRGISGGGVGARAANAVPSVAHASIDFRLVPRQSPARIRALVETHARAQGFHVVHAEPTADERLRHPRLLRLEWEEGYPASRTDMASPVARAVVRAVELGAGEPPIVVPTLGAACRSFTSMRCLARRWSRYPS
jgi:acetylornithine deacetylase/succinyl-diaminopimelate desuccinylase-like protein